MIHLLRRPAWVMLGSVAVGLAILFVNLGLWQLRRLGEVRLDNAVAIARLAAEPVPIELAVHPAADLVVAGEEHRFRRVVATGEFEPREEVLVRSQTNGGVAGFHVITPLVTDRAAILVNRGWVPLEFDTPPVPAAPPQGTVTLTLVLQATRERGRLGPEDPRGEADVVNRVDIARLGSQIEHPLYPVYGLEVAERDGLPVPVALPEFDDGPHLSYAIQWFAFAVIAVGGFWVLLRRSAQHGLQSVLDRQPRPPGVADDALG